MNRKLCIATEQWQGFAVKLEHRRFCELRSTRRMRDKVRIGYMPDLPEPDLEAVFRRDASFKATDQYLVRNG